MRQFIKNSLLALLFSLASLTVAHAACPGALELQDANNVKAPAKYTDDGSGNCQVNTAAQDGANVSLGAKGDSAWVSGSGSVIAVLKAIAGSVAGPPGLATTGGWTSVVKTGIGGTVVSIKPSAGWLGLVQCDNNNAAWSYLQIFNVASGGVTLGSTAPVQIVPIAPSLSNGFVSNVVGIQYSTAISVAATTSATGLTPTTTGLNCSFAFN